MEQRSRWSLSTSASTDLHPLCRFILEQPVWSRLAVQEKVLAFLLDSPMMGFVDLWVLFSGDGFVDLWVLFPVMGLLICGFCFSVMGC